MNKKGEPKSAAAKARDAAIEKGKVAAASAIAGVTGIPAPAVKKALDHWKITIAAVLVLASLPIIVIIGVTSTALNLASGGDACSTSAPTTLTGANLPPANQLSLFMAAERWQESHNNYSDVSAGATWDASYAGNWQLAGSSGAFGAYQYTQPTWYSYATRAGEGSYASVNPATLQAGLSQTVQDAVATYEFTTNYQDDAGNPVDTGNVWLWVAEQHFDPADALPADQNAAPGNNGGETMADYGNAVVGYMTSTPWLATAGGAAASTGIEVATGQCGATEVAGPLATKIVEIAKAEVGKTQAEEPTSGAWGPTGAEWCAYFASWVMQQAGVQPDPGSIGYSGDIWQWIGDNGGVELEPSATPQPGDMVLFGSGYADEGSLHVGIVAQVLPDGDITVVGGNEGTESNTSSSVQISTPFNPADAIEDGWPGPIWAYAQPPGA